MKVSAEQPKIIVVGSSSIDLVLNTSFHPEPNETVIAQNLKLFWRKRSQSNSRNSEIRRKYIFHWLCRNGSLWSTNFRNLVDENVNVGFVHEDLDHATGTAYVTAAHGKNAIVVVPSANYCLEPKHLENAERFFLQQI